MPQNEGILLSRPLNKTIFLQSVLYKTDKTVGKTIFVTPILEINVKMTTAPVLKNKKANVDLVDNIAPEVKQLIVFGHLLLNFLFYLLLLLELLLLCLVLLVHFLQPF